ncbi:hypothetical protein ACFYNZ_29070 [Streptomyces kebangsaanensis]|uniref:Transposase family protein n=1 Tax=Streptomyces kebangsaanensis TaxID=864058 RepID=A0ABW6L489_9ACTN
MLDVPRHVVQYVARLLVAHRRRIGTPKGSRVLGPFQQAVFVLSWFREAGCVHCLACAAGISQATGYRYLHEAIDVLADATPELHEVLDRCRAQQMSHMVLDGTLISCDRVAGTTEKGNDLWYSGGARHFEVPPWSGQLDTGMMSKVAEGLARLRAFTARDGCGSGPHPGGVFSVGTDPGRQAALGKRGEGRGRRPGPERRAPPWGIDIGPTPATARRSSGSQGPSSRQRAVP